MATAAPTGYECAVNEVAEVVRVECRRRPDAGSDFIPNAGSRTFTIAAPVPTSTTSLSVSANVDPLGVVSEGDETNNRASLTTQVGTRFVGRVNVTPRHGQATVGRPATLRVTWTHPESWRPWTPSRCASPSPGRSWSSRHWHGRRRRDAGLGTCGPAPGARLTAMVAIRTATVPDRPALASALASAFSEDPLFGWMAGPRAPLEGRMRIFFDVFLKQNLRRSDHLVFMAEDGTGGAIWQPVDRWKVPPADLVRALPAIMRAFRGRVPAMIGALNAIERQHPSEPHYYLEVLGTQKDRQSKGVGSAVMQAMLERCDREGLPAYLESSNPRNIPFYARHGFEVREEVSCGKGAPVATTMWREPRG